MQIKGVDLRHNMDSILSQSYYGFVYIIDHMFPMHTG